MPLLIALLGWMMAGAGAWAAKPGTAADFYRGEEFLAWDGAKDEGARQQARRLIEERRALIARLDTRNFKSVRTAFGERREEPDELKKFRQQEHQKIRALLPSGKEKEFQAFRQGWKQQVEAAGAAFPLMSNPPVTLQMTDDGSAVTVDLVVGAPSPLFQLEIDQVEETKDGVVVRATWVRPPLGVLAGKTVEAVQVAKKATFARRGKLEVWVRTRDEDLPFRTEYQRLLAFPLSSGG
jgi:hypothetical protein